MNKFNVFCDFVTFLKNDVISNTTHLYNDAVITCMFLISLSRVSELVQRNHVKSTWTLLLKPVRHCLFNLCFS